MSSALQWIKNLYTHFRLRNHVQSTDMAGLGADSGQLRGRSTNVRHKCGDTNAQLRNGVCWSDHADSDFIMSQSVWQPCVECMGNKSGHLRQVCDQSNESNQSDQPNKSCERHQCPRNPNRTCNCPDGCPDDDGWVVRHTNNARNYFSRVDHFRHDKFIGKRFPVYRVPEHGFFPCPVDSKACGAEFCEGGSCKESVTRAKAGNYWSYAETAHDSGIDND